MPSDPWSAKSAIKVVLALLPEPSRKEFPSVACFQPPSFTTISWEDPAAEAAMLLAFPSQSLRCPHRDCPRKGTAVGEGRKKLSLPHHCSSLKKIQTRTSTGQEPGVRSRWRPQRGAAYWRAPHGLLSLLSHRAQDHQPRDGTHNGQTLPHQSLVEIIQTCQQPCFMKPFS